MRRLQLCTIMLFALALAPVGAHLLELTNKMRLDRNAYMTVQQIYKGWDLLGIVLIASLIAGLTLTVLSRHQRVSFWLALAACALLGASLVIFFTWTFPVNTATNSWTVAPDNWAALRVQWEYSHAANAVVTFVALCSVTGSCLFWKT